MAAWKAVHHITRRRRRPRDIRFSAGRRLPSASESGLSRPARRQEPRRSPGARVHTALASSTISTADSAIREDGLTLCRSLRAAYPALAQVPVLMLAAQRGKRSIASSALEMSAVDFTCRSRFRSARPLARHPWHPASGTRPAGCGGLSCAELHRPAGWTLDTGLLTSPGGVVLPLSIGTGR